MTLAEQVAQLEKQNEELVQWNNNQYQTINSLHKEIRLFKDEILSMAYAKKRIGLQKSSIEHLLKKIDQMEAQAGRMRQIIDVWINQE